MNFILTFSRNTRILIKLYQRQMISYVLSFFSFLAYYFFNLFFFSTVEFSYWPWRCRPMHGFRPPWTILDIWWKWQHNAYMELKYLFEIHLLTSLPSWNIYSICHKWIATSFKFLQEMQKILQGSLYTEIMYLPDFYE